MHRDNWLNYKRYKSERMEKIIRYMNKYFFSVTGPILQKTGVNVFHMGA